jgi:hypothetical protein
MDISEELAAFIFSVQGFNNIEFLDPEDGDRKLLRNTGNCLPLNMAYPTRLESSSPLL